MANSRSVLRQLSDGLAELYAPASMPGGLDDAARVVDLAARLVPADSCSYNHIGGDGALLAWLIEPADVGTFPAASSYSSSICPSTPSWPTSGPPDGRARRISDFLSDRQFRSLGLYRDFYRRCGVDYQVAISVPAPGGGLIGIFLR